MISILSKCYGWLESPPKIFIIDRDSIWNKELRRQEILALLVKVQIAGNVELHMKSNKRDSLIFMHILFTQIVRTFLSINNKLSSVHCSKYISS